jgi:hypothetical protein
MAAENVSAHRGQVIKFPTAASAVDVRDLLLNNQSDPEVATPPALQAAIDARARVLAEEAYRLCREHLRRRVAFHAEWGHPTRMVDTERAYQAIAEGDLGDALARVYRQKMTNIVLSAKAACKISEQFAGVAEELFRVIDGTA